MSKRKIILIIASAVIVAVAVITFLLVTNNHKKPKPSNRTTNNSSKPLTAGGLPVPLQFQSKARKLGYYCPYWDAQAGQINSYVCFSLDK